MSAALLTRGCVFWLCKASDSPPRDAWLFLQGQFLTSQFHLLLYHRSNYSANPSVHTHHLSEVNNTPRLKSIHFDTMLAAFECYGDLDFLNLGFLCEKYLGKAKPSYQEMLGKKESPWDIPVTKLAEHACKDAETSFQLYRFLEKEMRSKGLMKQYLALTMPLCKVLGDLEYRGVKVYKDKLYLFCNSLLSKANELRQNINTAAGRNINIESDEEVKDYLLSVHGIPEWMNRNKPFTTFLEYLGAIRDIPRLIVRCRRLLKDAHSVSLIIDSITGFHEILTY